MPESQRLCSNCDACFLSPEQSLADKDDLIEQGLPILQWDLEPREEYVLKDTYPDFPALKESARAGCRLCEIFHQGRVLSMTESPRSLFGKPNHGDELEVCRKW